MFIWQDLAYICLIYMPDCMYIVCTLMYIVHCMYINAEMSNYCRDRCNTNNGLGDIMYVCPAIVLITVTRMILMAFI